MIRRLILAALDAAEAAWRRADPRAADLEALIEATRETTPVADAAWAAVIAKAARIDAAVADFAAEVEALADIELAELTKGDQ